MFFFSRFRAFLALGFAMCGLLPLLPLHAHGLLRALAGPGVRVGALTPHREAPAVPEALVAPDLDLPLDVLGHVPAEVTLDLEVPVDVLPDADDLLLGQVADLGPPSDTGAAHDDPGPLGADAVDVAQRDVHPLVAGEVHACDPCHATASSVPP